MNARSWPLLWLIKFVVIMITNDLEHKIKSLFQSRSWSLLKSWSGSNTIMITNTNQLLSFLGLTSISDDMFKPDGLKSIVIWLIRPDFKFKFKVYSALNVYDLVTFPLHFLTITPPRLHDNLIITKINVLGFIIFLKLCNARFWELFKRRFNFTMLHNAL